MAETPIQQQANCLQRLSKLTMWPWYLLKSCIVPSLLKS